MRILHTAICTFAALFVMAASGATLTWTGAAGDSCWTNYLNWSGATASTDFSTANDYVFNNLADGSTIKVAKYKNKPVIIGSLKMTSTSSRTWNFTPFDSNGRFYCLSTATFEIASGCTLNNGVRADNPWTNTYGGYTLTGGGAYRIKNSWESWGGYIYVNNGTLINAYGSGPQSALGYMYLKLMTNNSKFKLEATSYAKYVNSPTGIYPVIDLNGYKFVALLTSNNSYSGTLEGGSASSFYLMEPREFTLVTTPAMSGTYGTYASRFLFGTAAVPVSVPPDSIFDIAGNGVMEVFCDQSLSLLKGNGSTGELIIPYGSTISLNGTSDTISTSTYNGRISGGGNLVKWGDDYDLTVCGDTSSYSGNVEVAAGTLLLNRTPFEIGDDVVFYAPFDGNTYDYERTTSTKFDGYSTSHSLPTKSSGSGVFGDCIYTTDENAAHGARWVLADGKAPNKKINRSNWTMSVWIKPEDKDSGSKTRNGHFFNFGTWANTNPELRLQLALIQFEYYKSTGVQRIRDYSNDVRTPNLNLVDGNWHHVVYIQEPRAKYLWVDGVFYSKNENYTEDIYIKNAQIQLGGKDYWGKNNAFCGCIDELIVANGSWTEERILREYNRRAIPSSSSVPDLPSPSAHWSFDENYNDSIGGIEMVNGGSVTAKLVKVDGAIGKCLQLPGNSCLKLASLSAPANLPVGNKPFSVSIRQREGSVGEYTRSFCFGDPSTPWRYFSSGSISANRCPGFFFSLPQKSTSADAYFTDFPCGFGQTGSLGWENLMATYNGTNVMCYIDGILTKTVSATDMSLVGSVVYFGLNPYPPEDKYSYWKGYVDDVRVWTNCCLTAEQVRNVSRMISKEAENTDGVFANASILVDENAMLKVEGVGNAAKSVSGRGSLWINRDSSMKVGAFGDGFAGKITGTGILEYLGDSDLSESAADGFYGFLKIGGGISKLNSSYANCQIQLATGGLTGCGMAPIEVLDGAAIDVNSEVTDSPVLQTSGELQLPETMTINLTGPKPETSILVVEAGTLVLPSDLTHWTIPARYKLKIRGNRIYLEYRRGVAVIYF